MPTNLQLTLLKEIERDREKTRDNGYKRDERCIELNPPMTLPSGRWLFNCTYTHREAFTLINVKD